MRCPQTDASYRSSFIIVLLLLATAAIASASCHTITPSGAGTKSGADWNNSCAGFAGSCSVSSLVRGDTYFVASGSYPSVTFNTPTSGTSVITITAPTASNNCTSTGWNASTMQGQAQFGPIYFDTSYITFSGAYRGPQSCFGSGCQNDATSYGFSVNNNGPADSNQAVLIGCDGNACSPIATATNINFEYTWVKGSCPTSTASTTEDRDIWMHQANNIYLGYNRLECAGTNSVLTDYNASTVSGGTIVMEYNWFVNNGASQGHSEHYNIRNTAPGSTITVRYNYFENGIGAADISTAAAGNPTLNGTLDIYGNVFFQNTAEWGSWSPNPDGEWDGVVSFHGFNGTGIIRFLNNTIADFSAPSGCQSTCFTQAWWCSVDGGGSGFTGSGTFAVENNIWYHDNGGNGSFSGPTTSCGNPGTWAYNSYYATVVSDSTTGAVNEGSANPFTNAKQNVQNSDDFRLAVDTTPWTPLPAPYNVDPNGVTRTSSRGAFQFSGSGQAPVPPTNLTDIVQ